MATIMPQLLFKLKGLSLKFHFHLLTKLNNIYIYISSRMGFEYKISIKKIKNGTIMPKLLFKLKGLSLNFIFTL